MEGRGKTTKILRRKHPRDLFFHHQVFFEGLQGGLLLSFKNWPLEEVVVANTVTLLFGILVSKPDHCTERNTNSWSQNVQPGTALGLHKGPVLASQKEPPKLNKNLTPSHAPHFPSAVYSPV